MRRRSLTWLAPVVPLIAVVSLASAPAAAQASRASTRVAAKDGTPPRTSWGTPDLQGMWTSEGASGVPIERPAAFGTREFLTDEEFAKKQEEGRVLALDERKPNQPRGTAGPSHWYEWFARNSRRTSLIVDPPDGRVPWTPEAKKRVDSRPLALGRFEQIGPPRFGAFESWIDVDLWERCITRGVASAMIPTSYNNAYEILQTPEYVAIKYEMLDLRIIPMDGRPHIPSNISQWMGDSRGRWEGNTLVVDVTNFPVTTYSTLKAHGGSRFVTPTTQGRTGETLHMVERFTLVDADTIDYRVTVDDPKTFTRPVTITVPLTKNDGYQMFEYACHEGNYAMPAILAGARSAEKVAEEATKKK